MLSKWFMSVTNAPRLVGQTVARILLATAALVACSSPVVQDANRAASAEVPSSPTDGAVRAGCLSSPPAAVDTFPFPTTTRSAESGEWQAVGLLTTEDPNGNVELSCTGTLVGTEASIAAGVASVVLTSKHCRNVITASKASERLAMSFYIGNGHPFPAAAPEASRAMLTGMAGMRRYPSLIQVEIGEGTFQDQLRASSRKASPAGVIDLALVYLDNNVAGVTPLVLQSPTGDPTSLSMTLAQSSTQVIGLGQTDPGHPARNTYGEKKLIPVELAFPPESINIYEWFETEDIWNGSSGGPLVAHLPNVGVRVLGALATDIWAYRTDTMAIYTEISDALNARRNAPRDSSYGLTCASASTEPPPNPGVSPSDPAALGIH